MYYVFIKMFKMTALPVFKRKIVKNNLRRFILKSPNITKHFDGDRSLNRRN